MQISIKCSRSNIGEHNSAQSHNSRTVALRSPFCEDRGADDRRSCLSRVGIAYAAQQFATSHELVCISLRGVEEVQEEIECIIAGRHFLGQRSSAWMLSFHESRTFLITHDRQWLLQAADPQCMLRPSIFCAGVNADTYSCTSCAGICTRLASRSTAAM